MHLIDQHTKRIMEGCKRRALDAGLRFEDETLEYIVTNRDLIALSPKMMIPTLYDYWVHDVEVLREKRKYELYPGNPYETVINTRPAISFYNDNNPDWLNVMIFYHVLAHVDFFQNNLYFRHTWDYDFAGQALSDKRLIARLRSEKGRWVDYVIEFARGIDNLVGYYHTLNRLNTPQVPASMRRIDFYFDVFLQRIRKVPVSVYVKEVNRYNESRRSVPDGGEKHFFARIEKKYPEFQELFNRHMQQKTDSRRDVMEHIMTHSTWLNKDENKWMKQVLQVIRNTSLFFQPQIRTKILNEGWASYWHEQLFLSDDRIKGHEVDFARVHAGVTAMPKVGMNPYALGMRLFEHIASFAQKGRYSFAFQRLRNADARDAFAAEGKDGRAFLFDVRTNLNDFLFIQWFVDQDFINRFKLFVAGRRLNPSKMVWEYFIRSKKAADYKQMMLGTLYHPPTILVAQDKSAGNILYLEHRFEEKPLVRDYIENTMLGIEYLWGAPVKLETSEVVPMDSRGPGMRQDAAERVAPSDIRWQRVVYSMENRKLSRERLA